MRLTLRDEVWGYTPIYLLLFMIAVFAMTAGAIKAIGDDTLPRDQFNLGDDKTEDLETTARRFESITDRLRRIDDFKRRQEEAAAKQPPQVKREPARTLLLITAPGWCKPCARVEKLCLPPLVKQGWKIKKWEDDGVANIWVINRDATPDVANQFNGQYDVVPLWVLIVDGQVKLRQSGFLTSEQVQSFYRTK